MAAYFDVAGTAKLAAVVSQLLDLLRAKDDAIAPKLCVFVCRQTSAFLSQSEPAL